MRVDTVIQMRSLRIAQDEVHLADRLAVDAVGQHARRAVARHQLQAVGAEVRDQDVAVAGRTPARWAACPRGSASLRCRRSSKCSERRCVMICCSPSGCDTDDAAARVGRPRGCRPAPPGCIRAAAGRGRRSRARPRSMPKSRTGLPPMASVPRIKSSLICPDARVGRTIAPAPTDNRLLLDRPCRPQIGSARFAWRNPFSACAERRARLEPVPRLRPRHKRTRASARQAGSLARELRRGRLGASSA